jgi:dienelactone hydrolase
MGLMRLPRIVMAAALAAHVFAAKPNEWQDLRTQIRRTLHVPDQLPALREKTYLPFTPAPGVQADRVSYTTDYDLRVPAIVYHSAGATIVKHPALVIVNGHGGDKSSIYAYWAGILYARAGAVVLTYDPIGEFERNHERRSETSQHDQVIAPDDMALRLTGLMVTDVLQAVHYLASRKDVDAQRIAVLGFSMGSFISSLACSATTDIHACVLVGGGDLDGPGGYWDSSSKVMCQSTAYRALSFLGDRGPILFALNAKRGPTLIWNGSDDTVVDIVHHGQDFFERLRADTIARLHSPKDVFDFGFTPGGGHRAYFLSRPVALWLNEKLKFPDWTKKQLEAMPEIRMSDWMTRNHLPVSANANYERNEGGLLALGDDIPVVSRPDLHAIPDTIWAADQDDYIYESWVDRAKAASSASR